MRTASTCLVVFCMAGCPAWGQGGVTANNDVREGHHVAAMVCGVCHVAAADQSTPPILQPPAPSFESIAQRKDVTADLLKEFITTTHRTLATQKGMPNPDLADFQVKQVVAYILSLRK